MIGFVDLYAQLDSTTKSSKKLAAIAEFFASAEPSDASWAIYFLIGERLRRVVPTKLLRQWAAEAAEIPDWLFEESYHSVGDLAETIALVVPPGGSTELCSLTQWVEETLIPLKDLSESDQREKVLAIWKATTPEVRFVVMKLMTGALRVGVSKRSVIKAIATQYDLPVDVIAHRMMGEWEPTPEALESLCSQEFEQVDSKPYPFCLAHALTDPIESLGECDEYLAEWKWDGIRGQVIRREGKAYIWSRGEELMEGKWPEIEAAAEKLPNGTVIDGEILGIQGGTVLPFGELQRRIGRKKVGKKLLAEVPVGFRAFDLLEENGVDIRLQTQEERRSRLERLLPEEGVIQCTEVLKAANWDELSRIRESSRRHQAEGLMLKRRSGTYDVGRVRGTWWKWKVDPYTVDAVMIYAQKGHGRRANLFTDYTFAIWNENELVPFAKAYSGLSDAEIREVDRFVRKNTLDSFGPVRSVRHEIVMELAFEGLQKSTRHKSGIATRFPRIVRIRSDKKPEDANHLSDLLEMMEHASDTSSG
ncbi:MAG: ATP-dependent DNA ligase [Planctomycetota bacterium]